MFIYLSISIYIWWSEVDFVLTYFVVKRGERVLCEWVSLTIVANSDSPPHVEEGAGEYRSLAKLRIQRALPLRRRWEVREGAQRARRRGDWSGCEARGASLLATSITSQGLNSFIICLSSLLCYFYCVFIYFILILILIFKNIFVFNLKNCHKLVSSL